MKINAEDVSSQNQIKSSAQRAIKSAILSQFPRLEPVINDIFSKKPPLIIAKCPDHISLVVKDGLTLFFQQRDGPWVPSLRLIHKYPTMLPKMQVDSGALKFVLRGSNIMCPGLTSPGGRMEEVEAGVIVQIIIENRENACAVGKTIMSTREIIEKNKDVCIENLHYLNDGLWNLSL
ncbi:PUA domain protein [Babesia microti strain RI]|uniref:PUA domain protein n=1 Tax=Babesia microti (strain RI) TaxID=1133968 RepID=A0A1N6LX72_BABMR|nr:PUA domain protein [Babesia microti strain RI]SIO73465.1 PUA domain protein [Babesia microti strain RI]|eukprot:XP_021337561.1 PUA domain protein [Babesia microti strain RI]